MGDLMSFFFFQAEDGIRDTSVTGVQTCALPIFPLSLLAGYLLRAFPLPRTERLSGDSPPEATAEHRRASQARPAEIGRASCRERAENLGRALPIEEREYRNQRNGARERVTQQAE